MSFAAKLHRNNLVSFCEKFCFLFFVFAAENDLCLSN